MATHNTKAGKPELAEARERGLLNIGEAATASGVSAKSIRNYETIGLIPPADRTFANYRLYKATDVQTLRFVKHARQMGFSIEKIRDLLSLWQNRKRSSASVKKLALEHIDELDQKIKELQAMRDSLQALARSCHGDERPDCPILEGFADET